MCSVVAASSAVTSMFRSLGPGKTSSLVDQGQFPGNCMSGTTRLHRELDMGTAARTKLHFPGNHVLL